MARKIEAKVLTHHGIARDRGAPAAAGERGQRQQRRGATVHALSPQPKPASEKTRR